MKAIITMIICIFSITGAVAGNGTGINQVIGKQLKVPVELKSSKLNEKVNVQFKLNSNGTIVVLDVKTTNQELKNYVEKELPKINLSNAVENKETVYFVDLNFKVL
ncbi:MAG: hypothetical protein JNL24_06460 [Bacteroidia bacterium]|nr:hypothetical protein [Bacteroidia bacterium]